MYKLFLLSGILALFLFSCTPPEPVSVAPELILLQQSGDVLPISSFSESVDYVELKLDKTGISLGEVMGVKQLKDDWIIQHRMSGQTSFIRLDRNGDFISELAGRNVKEISEPKDIIAFENGFAVLADNGIHELSSDGKYVKRISSGEFLGRQFFEADGKLLVLNEIYSNQILTDADDKSSEVNQQNFLNNRVQRMMYTSVQTVGSEIHFYSVLSDSLYLFENGRTKTMTRLAGESSPTFAEIVRTMQNLEENEALKFLRESEHIMVKKYLENSKYIFITYWVGSLSSTVLLDKVSGSTLYFAHGVNDLDGGIWEEPFFLTGKNELVVPLSAYKLSGHKITNKKERQFSRLQDKIAESGNPVLMLCKLK